MPTIGRLHHVCRVRPLRRDGAERCGGIAAACRCKPCPARRPRDGTLRETISVSGSDLIAMRADPNAVFAALHFQFGDSGFLHHLDQFFDFFNRHLLFCRGETLATHRNSSSLLVGVRTLATMSLSRRPCPRCGLRRTLLIYTRLDRDRHSRFQLCRSPSGRYVGAHVFPVRARVPSSG